MRQHTNSTFAMPTISGGAGAVPPARLASAMADGSTGAGGASATTVGARGCSSPNPAGLASDGLIEGRQIILSGAVAAAAAKPHHVVLSFAEGDPMLLIYPLLLRLQEKGAPLSLLVPQTVLYEHHFPRAWYAIEPQTESQKQRRIKDDQHHQQQKLLQMHHLQQQQHEQHHHLSADASGGGGDDGQSRGASAGGGMLDGAAGGVDDGGILSTHYDDDLRGGGGGSVFASGARLPPSSARRLRGGPPPSTLSGSAGNSGTVLAGGGTRNNTTLGAAGSSLKGSSSKGTDIQSTLAANAAQSKKHAPDTDSSPCRTNRTTTVKHTERGQVPQDQRQQQGRAHQEDRQPRQLRRESDAGGAAEARLLLNAGSTTSSSAVGRLEQEREWASALTITRRGGRSCDATSVKQHFVAPVDAYFVAAVKAAHLPAGGVGLGGGGGSLLSVDPRIVEAARQYLTRSGIAALLGSVDPLVPRRRHVVHSIDNVQSWFDVHHFSTTTTKPNRMTGANRSIEGLNDDTSSGIASPSHKRSQAHSQGSSGSSPPPSHHRLQPSPTASACASPHHHPHPSEGGGENHHSRPGSAALRYHFLPDLIGDPPAAVARHQRQGAHDTSSSQAASIHAAPSHKSSSSLLPLLCGPTVASGSAASAGVVEVHTNTSVAAGGGGGGDGAAAVFTAPDEYIGSLLAMRCGPPAGTSGGGGGGGGMVVAGGGGSGSGGVFTGSYGPGDLMITALGHSGVERMLMHTPDTAVLTRYDLDNFGNDDSYDFFTNNNHAASTAQRHREEQRKQKAREGGGGAGTSGSGGGLNSSAHGKQKAQPAAAASAAATSAALAAGLRRRHEVVVAVWTPQCFSVELRVANADLYDTSVPVSVRADTHTLTHYREAPACAFMTNQIRDALTRFAAAVERYEGKRVLLFRGFFRLDACQRPWLIFCDDLQVAPAPLVAAAAASASAAGAKGVGIAAATTGGASTTVPGAALSPMSAEQQQQRSRGAAAAAVESGLSGQALPPLVQIKTDQIRTFEREEQRRLAEIKRLKEQQRLNPLLGGTSSLFGSLGASSNATAATIAALTSESQRQRKKHCTGTQQPLSMFDPEHIYAQYHEALRAAREAAAANRKQRNNSRHNSTAMDRDGARGSVVAGLEDESTARGVQDDSSLQHAQRRSLGYSVVSDTASYALAGPIGGGIDFDVSAGAGSVGYFSPSNDRHRHRPSGATGGVEEENPQLVALRQAVSGMLPLSPPAPQRRNRLLTAMLASSADRDGARDRDSSSFADGSVHRKPLYAPGTRDYYHVPRAAQLQLLSRVLAEGEEEPQQQEVGVGDNPRRMLMLVESKEDGLYTTTEGESTLAAQTPQQQQEEAASSASPPMSPGTPPRTQQHTRRATVALLAPEDTPAALLAALSHPAALAATPSNNTTTATASTSTGMVRRGGSIMAPRPLPASSGSNNRGSGSDGLPAPLTIAAMRGRVAAYARWIGEDAADDTAVAANAKQQQQQRGSGTANTNNTSTTANANQNAGSAASPPAGVLKRSPSVDSNGQPLWTPQDRRRQLLRRLRRQLPQALVDHPDITDTLLLNVEDEVNRVISGGGGSSSAASAAASGGSGSNTKTQQLQFRRRIQQYLEREETLRRKRQRALHPPLPLLRQSPKDIRCVVHFTGADLLLEAAGSSLSTTSASQSPQQLSQQQHPPLWCHVPENWLALSSTLRERIAMMAGAAQDQAGRASARTGESLPHARRRIACESFEAAVGLQERLYTDHAAEYIVVFNKGVPSSSSSTCQHQTVDAAMPGYFYWYPPQSHEVLRARYLKLTARRRDLQRAYHVELRRRQQQEAARWGVAGGGGRRRRSSIGASFMRSTRSTETRAARRGSDVGVNESESSLAGLGGRGGAVEGETGRRPDSAGSTQGRLSRAESFATSDKDSAELAAPASPAASFTGKHALVDSPHGGSVASEGTAGASRRLSGSLSRAGSASGRGASAAAVGMPPIDAFMANLARQQMLEQLLPPGTNMSTSAPSKHNEDIVSTTNRALHSDHQADPEAAPGSTPHRPSNTTAPAPHYLFVDHTADYCYQGNFYRSDMRDYHYAVAASSEAALYGGGVGGAGSSRPASPQATSRGGVAGSAAATTAATTDSSPQSLSRHGSLMQQGASSSSTTVVVSDYRYYYHDFMLKNGGLQTEQAMHYYDRVVIPHADAAREAVIAAAERDSTRHGQQRHLSHSRLSQSSEAPASSGPAPAGTPQASTVPLTKRTYSLFYAKKESSGGAGDDDDMDDLDGGGLDGNFSFSPSGGGDGGGGSGEGYLRKVNPFQLYMANFAEPDVYTLMPAAPAPPPSPRLPHCQAEDRALPNLELFGSIDPTDMALSGAGADSVGRGRLLFLPTFNNNRTAKMGSPSDGSGTSRPDALLAQVIAVEDLYQRAQQTKFTLPPPLRPPVLVPSTPLTAHEEMLLKVELLVRLGLAPKTSLVTYYERVRQLREKKPEGAGDDADDDRNSDDASAHNTKEFAILKEIVEKSALLTSRLADAVMFPPIEELRPLLENPNRVDPNEGDPRKHPDKSNKGNISATTKKNDSTTTSHSSGAHPHVSSPQDPRRFLQAQREKKLKEAMGKNVKHVGVSFERRRNKKDKNEKDEKHSLLQQPRLQTGNDEDPLQQQEQPRDAAAGKTTAPKQKVLSTIAMLLLSERGKKSGRRKADPPSSAASPLTHDGVDATSPLADGGGARRAERRRRRSGNSSRDDGEKSSDVESSNSSSGTDLMRQLVYDNTASDRAPVYGTSTVSTARDAVSGSGRQHVSKTSQHRLNHTTVINAFVSNAAERRSRSFARRATATNIALTLHEGEQGALEADGGGGVGGGGADASITDFNMSAIPFESTMTFDPLHLSSSAGGTATPPTLLTPDISGAHIQPDAARGDDAGPSASSRSMMQRKRSVVIEGGQRRTAALKVKTVRERMREHIYNVGSTPGFNINNVSCSSSDDEETDHARDDPFQKGSSSTALTTPSPGGFPLGSGVVGFNFNSRRPTSGSIASSGTHDDTQHLNAAAGGGAPDPAEASCTTPRRAARRQKSTVFLLPPEASESASVSGGGDGGADSTADGKEGGDGGVGANSETIPPTNPSRQAAAIRRRSSMKLAGSSAALRRRSSVAACVSFARSGSLSVSAADTATAQGVLDLETIFVDRGLVAPVPVCLAAVTSDRSSRSAASGVPLVSPLLPTFAATSPPLSPMSEGGLPSSPATIGGPSSPPQQRTPSKAQLLAHKGGPPTGVTMHAALRAAYNEALGGAAATATTAPSAAEIAEFDAQRNNPHYKMTRSNVILNPKYAAVVRALDVDDRVELETMLARHAQLFAEIDDMEYSVFSKALVCDEGLSLYVEPPAAPAAKTGPPNSNKRTKDAKGQRTEGPRSTPLSEVGKTSPRSIRRKGGAPQTQESAFFHPTSSDDDRSGRSSSSEGAPSKHRASSGGHRHAVSAAVSAATGPPAPRRVYLLHFPHRLYMPTDEQLHACGFLVPHALYTAPGGGGGGGGGVGAGSTSGGGTVALSPSSTGGHVTARGSSAGSGPSSNRLAEPTAVDEDYGQNTALSVLMGMSLARGPAHITTSGKTGEPHRADIPSPVTAASLRAAVPQEVLREVTRFGCFALPVASALSTSSSTTTHTASSHVRQGSASANPNRGAEAAVGHGSSSLDAATRVTIATEAFRRLRRCIRRRMDEIELDFLVGGR